MNFTTILCIFRDCRFSPLFLSEISRIIVESNVPLDIGCFILACSRNFVRKCYVFFFLFPCKIGENRREKRLTSKGSDKLRMFSMLSKANSSYWINWSVYKALFRFDWKIAFLLFFFVNLPLLAEWQTIYSYKKLKNNPESRKWWCV